MSASLDAPERVEESTRGPSRADELEAETVPNDFAYSDGTTVEEKVLERLRAAADRSSDAWIAREEQDRSWPLRYHLSPLRANLLSHLDLDGLRVLELGAGMGGASRSLAERAERFVGVEGSARRADGLRLRLDDLEGAEAVVGRLEEVELEGRFDLVCVVGVLEYSELHLTVPDGVDPFEHFLRRASSHLAPGGVLALAIENRLGIKYWTGATEDHTGRHFDGVAGYSASPSPRTFSRAELRRLVARAGLETLAEHWPFPDYKLPHQVLDARLAERDPRLAVDMACFSPFVGHETRRVHLLPDYLALESLASAGLLADFVNSFLLFVGREGDEDARRRMRAMVDPGELAWHYAPDRAVPTRTTVRDRDGALWIEKTVLESPDAASIEPGAETALAVWQPPEPGPPAPGIPLRLRLVRDLYFGDSERVVAALVDFLDWARARFGADDAERLDGLALDAVVRNASYRSGSSDAPDRYVVYDLEWRAVEPIEQSWFVLRNVLALSDDFSTAGRRSRWTSLEALYRDVCAAAGIESRLEADLDREAELLGTVLGRPAPRVRARLEEALTRTYERRFGGLLGQIATGQQPEVAVLAQRVDHLERATRTLLEASDRQARAVGRFDATLGEFHQVFGRQQESLSRLHAAQQEEQESVGSLHDALARIERIVFETSQAYAGRTEELLQERERRALAEGRLQAEAAARAEREEDRARQLREVEDRRAERARLLDEQRRIVDELLEHKLGPRSLGAVLKRLVSRDRSRSR